MSQRVPVRCCGDLSCATDSTNDSIIFQRKSFINFTVILFDVSEKLLTVKTAYCNDLIVSLPGNKYMLKARKKCEIYSNLTIKTKKRCQ